MTARSCLSVLVLVFAAATAAAQEPTPIPDFTGDRVRVAGVPDSYGPLRDDVRRLEGSSGRTYYVVVASSGPGANATKVYTDRLRAAWERQAADRALKLDPDRSVLIVLAVNNKQLSMHPGTALREKDRLTEEVIDEQLVQPHFVPRARDKEYVEGLRALLNATDRWIVAKEAPLLPPQTVPALVEKGPAREVVQAADLAPRAAPQPRQGLGAGGWIAIVALVVLLLIGIQSLRYVLARRSAVRRFEGFRERVMRLREGVEAVRERHRLLTEAGKGYTEPMSGRTLEVYRQVKTDADRLWDAWLQKMEVWERVQLLIRAGRFPRVGPLSEAPEPPPGTGSTGTSQSSW